MQIPHVVICHIHSVVHIIINKTVKPANIISIEGMQRVTEPAIFEKEKKNTLSPRYKLIACRFLW